MNKKKYGLIGYPLGHSFSKKYFDTKFENEDIEASFENYELEHIDSFSKLKEDDLIKGLSVTIPYKEKIIDFVDELDISAREVGAVNSIKFSKKNGKKYLIGFNTDVYGFRKSINEFLKKNHTKALILGTGGAAKAVKCALDMLNIDSVFVSRTAKKNMYSYEMLNKDIMLEYTIIINTTPLGTYPNVDTCVNIPFVYLTKDHLLFDLVYNPELTKFLNEGQIRGAEIVNGLKMLHYQAEESWLIWNK